MSKIAKSAQVANLGCGRKKWLDAVAIEAEKMAGGAGDGDCFLLKQGLSCISCCFGQNHCFFFMFLCATLLVQPFEIIFVAVENKMAGCGGD